MAHVLTIDETIKQLHISLMDYIEATYHISHPSIIKQRKILLEEVGVIHQKPFLESTPRYKSGGRFADLDLPSPVLDIFKTISEASNGNKNLIFRVFVGPGVDVVGILVHGPG